jgi:hypothetical protein
MTKFRPLALFLAMLAVYAAGNVALDAQTKTPASQSDSISVSVSVRMDKTAAGPRPWAIVTVKNIGNRDVSLRTDMVDYHVYVEDENGERPKTSYHRSVRGEFQPGDKDLPGGGIVDTIPPGKSQVCKFDLVRFYDLRVPGKYAAYIEVQDSLSHTWLRTNTVLFTLEASAL